MTNNITNEQIINAIDNGCVKELRALADGKVIQSTNAIGGWVDTSASHCPVQFTRGYKFRVKPVEKTVTHYSVMSEVNEGCIEVHTTPPAKGCDVRIVDVHTFTYTEEE